MKYFITFALIALFTMPIHQAHAVEYAQKYVPNLQKLGEGRFSFMVWDVYDAALYAPEGQWQKGGPVILTLSYLRNLEGQKIAESSLDEIKKQNIEDAEKLDQWLTEMENIFPDVTEGDIITGIYTADKETIFYKNSEQLGKITDPEFGEVFFNIWLGEQTIAPDLRAQLLGLK